MNSQFEGQYQDEKILFKKHENLASVFFRVSPKIFTIIIFGTIFSTITYYISNNVIYSLIPGVVFFLILVTYLFFTIKFHKETFFAFTNKRAVKSVRNGLFSSHLKELKIENIRQTTSNSFGILGKIFGYGNINVQGPEKETSLYFKSISENKSIVLYISRMIDLIKNGEEADLWSFKSNFKSKVKK